MRWLRVMRLLATCTLLAYGGHQAFADDTLTFSAEQRLRTDSNLFRQPKGQRQINQAQPTRSDTIHTSLLGVKLDKLYSLQRVELDAQVAALRYRRFDYLDHNTLNYRAAWHWSLTPRVHGELARDRKEYANDFADFRTRTRNMRTEHITRAEAEAELGRDWHMLALLSTMRRTNEQPVEQEGDFSLRNAAVGLRRSSPFGSWISYRLRDGRGEYINRETATAELPTAFDELEHELRASWPVTEKTTLSGRLAYLERDFISLPTRNYGGVVGAIDLNWQFSSKLGVQMGLRRDIYAYQTAGASYSVARGASLMPHWQIGPRTRLQFNYAYSVQDFGGALLTEAVDAGRRDTLQSSALILQWHPLNALSLSAGVRQSRRGSNVSAYRFTSHGANVSAKFDF